MTDHLSDETRRLLAAYSAPVPRYTSYPTAPHFAADVGTGDFTSWLQALKPGDGLSVYVHIPFCDTLCWFCGCHTKITRRYAPVGNYLDLLEMEIERTSAYVTRGVEVGTIHWGGGSPTILEACDIERLAAMIRNRFEVAPDAEFAVEIDPRGFDRARIEALAAAGVTRASIGVQDFDPQVQTAINRVQSFDETRQAVQWLREAGVGSINIDAMYGLPHQTVDAVLRTAEQVIELDPDRVSLFGYAHVPWLKRHQSMIDEAILPGGEERYRQSRAAADLLSGAGYRRIGFDHFAKPSDSMFLAMNDGALGRNFQGYTADMSDALVGFGASAISSLPQGYCQNETALPQYRKRLLSGGLATAKGVRLDREDVARRWVIEQIMCDLSFSARTVRERFADAASGVLADADDVGHFMRDGLIEATDDGFRVTDTGRPFVRSICAHFDTYLRHRTARHSTAV